MTFNFRIGWIWNFLDTFFLNGLQRCPLAHFPMFFLALICFGLSTLVHAFFSKEVVVLTDDNFQSQVENSKEAWLIDYYAPWCGYCKQMKDDYSNAAKELQGKIKLGAVDCTSADSKELCNRLKIQGFPTLYIWPVSSKGERENPVLFQGSRTKNGFVNEMLRRTPTFALSQISSKELYEFLKDDKGSESIPRVVFFTTREEPAYLWYGLSASYYGRIKMAWSSHSNVGGIEGISSFPAAILLGKDGKRKVLSGASELKYENIKPLLKKMLSVPSPIVEITSQEQFDTACSETNGNIVCMIAFLALQPEYPESVAENQEQLLVLHQVAAKYSQIKFVWINPLKHFALGKKFSVPDTFPQMLLVKPKKKLYRNMNCAFEAKAIGTFIEGITSGKTKVKEYSGGLLLDVPINKEEL
jgi:protein disulfide-isomerase-like protein